MNGTKEVASRIVKAQEDFIEILMNIAGCSAEQALKVLQYYLDNKIAKTDFRIGRVQVVHGAFLDKESILKAIEITAG